MIECSNPNGCVWLDKKGMCVNSCYRTYSRNLVAKWDAEDAERAARGKYLGCPVCKQEVRFSCYHDGRDYSSVELPEDWKPTLRDAWPERVDEQARPWPGQDGRCTEHTLRIPKSALGHDPVRVIVGGGAHVNWRDGRIRDLSALRDMIELLQAAEIVMLEARAEQYPCS